MDAASSSGSSSSSAPPRKTNISKRANPPQSAQEGFRQAYESLSRGLQSAASQLIVVPREDFQRYGTKGAVKSALKAMPSAMLSPVIGGMEAIAKALNGITNSIDPTRRKEADDKFKGSHKSHSS
jgi:autophagy-related protein 2